MMRRVWSEQRRYSNSMRSEHAKDPPQLFHT